MFDMTQEFVPNNENGSLLNILFFGNDKEQAASIRAIPIFSAQNVTYLFSLEVLPLYEQKNFDLVILDVGPEQLANVLSTIRSQQNLQDVSVLVRAIHLTENYPVAALLSKYRAMPCHDKELIVLLKHRLLKTKK